MIPESLYQVDYNDPEMRPSKTYKLNYQYGHIAGMVDGFDAIAQAALKVLNTERFAYEIYNAAYGIELESLIGQDSSYIQTVLEDRVKEALLQDNRISDVTNFTITQADSESLAVSFTVQSISGSGNIEMGLIP